ncbi:MAG: hypothetical protein EOO92_00700 [Pedobacter sp.]|nr:MAG: hypothetical protein EOO92_00700 [Pedobacter sp.]
MSHTFHIPVLGLGYSIDTPLKVAKYGIASVVSIVDDDLTERMRKHISALHKEPYQEIIKTAYDCRAKRITAYLNLLNKVVQSQVNAFQYQDFSENSDLCKYFELMPTEAGLRKEYKEMMRLPDGCIKKRLQAHLRRKINAGSINVNIMSKVDKANFADGAYLGDEHTDALAALRGFAMSELNSSLIISAGLNPRLFSYIEKFKDFYPTPNGRFSKQIILKVSDYRSALIQAKVLAKKGLWISEFRIESGLNCGGHAFATDGFLAGPILQEFKDKRADLYNELREIYVAALNSKGHPLPAPVKQNITYQGGIGTAEEHKFLLENYQLDATGWGSPFLLVPEVTNVDEKTLTDLTDATESDFYVSNASPLGVPFNNFSKSSAEKQRLERIAKGRPGSPCTKKYLCTNTEFTEQPICTASREYQNLKIKQLGSSGLSMPQLKEQVAKVTEKVCLCVGLCNSAYLKTEILKPRENKAVSICPGPNIAYFSKVYSLRDMVDHIYDRNNLLQKDNRPNLFIKELELYTEYLRKELEVLQDDLKKMKYLEKFYAQLENGVNYYKNFIGQTKADISIWDNYQRNLFNQHVEKLKNLLMISN